MRSLSVQKSFSRTFSKKYEKEVFLGRFLENIKGLYRGRLPRQDTTELSLLVKPEGCWRFSKILRSATKLTQPGSLYETLDVNFGTVPAIPYY